MHIQIHIGHMNFLTMSFFDDHKDMGSLSMRSSLKKTDSPTLSSHELPITLQLGIGICEPSPIVVNMLSGVILCKFYARKNSV